MNRQPGARVSGGQGGQGGGRANYGPTPAQIRASAAADVASYGGGGNGQGGGQAGGYGVPRYGQRAEREWR